jgi:hypothetical protein
MARSQVLPDFLIETTTKSDFATWRLKTMRPIKGFSHRLTPFPSFIDDLLL